MDLHLILIPFVARSEIASRSSSHLAPSWRVTTSFVRKLLSMLRMWRCCYRSMSVIIPIFVSLIRRQPTPCYQIGIDPMSSTLSGASEYHTLNAGRLMKSAGPPLPPAWSHIPIGYHGRASSIVVSGTPIRRPKGVLPPPPGSSAMPSFGPTKTLDMEFEIAAIVGGAGNEMGESIGVDETSENVFGLVIMNDWSAR